MPYRTVNLRPETYRRLAAYRVLGLSFDDVVAHLMDRVPLKKLHGELVRRAARELEVPGAAEDVVLEFREVPRGAHPGAASRAGAPKPAGRAPAKAPAKAPRT